MRPQLIRLFLAEEIPDGLRTIELSNTTIVGTIFPRASIDKFAKREAAEKPGVYLLLGLDEGDPSVLRAYVGEGDPVLPRLRSHVANKEFWTQAVVFTSKDDYLTKTQIQFLEASILERLKKASRSRIDNGNVPTLPNMSEPERSEVKHFLEVLSLLLASVGMNILEPRSATVKVSPRNKEIFSYNVKSAKAKMVTSPQGYVILKSSSAVRKDRPSSASFIARMRRSLSEAGVLIVKDESLFEFTADAPFDSASTAAAIIAGGNVNGRIKWKLADGRTLKDIEVASAEEEDDSHRGK